MAIDMTTVKQIRKSGPLYKKNIYVSHSSIVYAGTSNPCQIEVTIYSSTTNTPTITASNLYTVLGTCGYTSYSNRVYLTVENPYDFVYNNGTYDCVFASFQARSSGLYIWFSVPGATSAGVYQNLTIIEDPWEEVEEKLTFDYQYKTYVKTTAGSYTNFTVGMDYETGEEYIANYCVNGVSYPNVTITSISGNAYTLSNQQTITTSYNYSSTLDLAKEIIKIEDLYGNTLWQKVTVGWHTVWEGTQRIGNGGSSSFTFGNVPFVDGLKFRVTFTNLAAIISAGDSGSRTYVPSNQTSPYEVTIVNNATTLLQASAYNTSHQSNASANMIYLKTTGDITASYSYRDSFASAYYIVTKIEAYY